MNKTAAVREIVEAAGDVPVVFTTGYSCRIAQHLGGGGRHFYMTGSMGLAVPVGVGIALATGEPVVVVDGDGSALMNPAALIDAAAGAAPALVHVVLDDGAYASTGGQPAPSARVDLAGLAAAAGYTQAGRVADPGALGSAVRRGLDEPIGPIFLHCPLNAPDDRVPPRITADLAEHRRRFSDHLHTSAGL